MMVKEQGFELHEITESPKLKEIFDSLISEIPKDLLETIKTFVENNLSKITGIDGGLEIRIVIDANVVFSQTIGYIKYGSLPSIIRLSKSPFVKIYAPPKIFEETIGNESELFKITRKVGGEITVEEVKQKILEILEHVKILNPGGDKEFELAKKLIGGRDPDDVDYLHLCFSIKAGIVTRDTHFDNLPKVQKWENLGQVKNYR